MVKVLILVLLAASAAFGQQCGVSPSMRVNRRFDPEGQRIVGGQEARPGSHPWIVSLQMGSSHFCGGTIVAEDVVVTAAHCVADGSPSKIVAGAHNHNSPSGVQSSSPSRITMHPQYNPQTTMNDIAVIKLATPFKFNDKVMPACLPSAGEQVPDNTQGTVAGWGLTREGGFDTSDVLMQVGVPTISQSTCASQYRSQGIAIDGKAMLCAGFNQGGKDSCQGDSGGPFVFKNSKGTYTLQGVVSFGIGCARAGAPGVYARVSNYLSFIEQAAGKKLQG